MVLGRWGFLLVNMSLGLSMDRKGSIRFESVYGGVTLANVG